MAFIEWSDDLSVKNLIIDSEHKKLVETTNKLHAAMREGKGSAVLGNILNELITYTKTHFKNEENIMRQHNYVHLDEHIAEHNTFVKEVETFYEKYKSGSVAVTISLISFLKDWLVKHIQGSDKKFGLSISK